MERKLYTEFDADPGFQNSLIAIGFLNAAIKARR